MTGRPKHPYSVALTAAAPVPRPAEQARRRAIRQAHGRGSASAGQGDAGCPFAPRCPAATDVCWAQRPPLRLWTGGCWPAITRRRCRHCRALHYSSFAVALSSLMLERSDTAMTSAASRPFPTGFLWAWPPPATRTKATTPPVTPGSSRTSPYHLRPNRPALPATPGSSGRRPGPGGRPRTQRLSLLHRVGPGRAPQDFDAGALDHYKAVVDGCRERGLAPVVTFNHFTSPHWFAARSWLDRRARAVRPLLRAGDGPLRRRIAFAVTLNEPNLPEMLSGRVCRRSSPRSSGRRWGRRGPPPECSATGQQRHAARGLRRQPRA